MSLLSVLYNVLNTSQEPIDTKNTTPDIKIDTESNYPELADSEPPYKFPTFWQETKFTGCWSTTQITTVRYTKIGNQVSVMIPSVLAAQNSSTNITFTAPSQVLPTTTQYIPILIQDSGTNKTGILQVGFSGNFTISGFTNTTGTGGLLPTTVFYSL
jgi:hypothetical protein